MTFGWFQQFYCKIVLFWFVESGSATCTFFLTSTCSKGSLCPFRHIKGERAVVCKHWLRGLCKKGDDCEFLHEFDMTKMPECYFFSRFGEWQLYWTCVSQVVFYSITLTYLLNGLLAVVEHSRGDHLDLLTSLGGRSLFTLHSSQMTQSRCATGTEFLDMDSDRCGGWGALHRHNLITGNHGYNITV